MTKMHQSAENEPQLHLPRQRSAQQLEGINAEHVSARARISVPQQQPELSLHVQRQSTVEPQPQSRRVADAKLDSYEALESNTTESEALTASLLRLSLTAADGCQD